MGDVQRDEEMLACTDRSSPQPARSRTAACACARASVRSNKMPQCGEGRTLDAGRWALTVARARVRARSRARGRTQARARCEARRAERRSGGGMLARARSSLRLRKKRKNLISCARRARSEESDHGDIIGGVAARRSSQPAAAHPTPRGGCALSPAQLHLGLGGAALRDIDALHRAQHAIGPQLRLIAHSARALS